MSVQIAAVAIFFAIDRHPFPDRPCPVSRPMIHRSQR
jgi:hypothetical protein